MECLGRMDLSSSREIQREVRRSSMALKEAGGDSESFNVLFCCFIDGGDRFYGPTISNYLRRSLVFEVYIQTVR